MKTRRIVLCLITLLTLSLLFVACAPTDGTGKNGELSLTDEVSKVALKDTVYKIIYNGDKVNESGIIRDFNTSLNAKTGKAYERTPYAGEAIGSAIVVGTVENCDGYQTLKEKTSEFSNTELGSFAIRMNGNILQIVASDSASLKAGCEYFVDKLCEAGSEITIDETFSVCILFNKNDYFTKGEITKIDTTTVTADATLASITVDGTAIDGFSGDVKSYTVNGVPYATRYPTVGAVPVFAGATVSVTQASDENGGVATITVTGRDPKSDGTYNTETYTVTFGLNEISESNAKIVWRGGTQGVVVFVIGDDDATEDFVHEEILHKYSALLVTTDSAYIGEKGASEEWNEMIDQAIEAGEQTILCIPRIVVDDFPTDGESYTFSQTEADIMFAYANTRSAEGKLWIATMAEATAYAGLRSYARIKAETFRDERVDVTLTTVDEDASNSDESLDQISLTVKVDVPSDWSGTVIASNGASAEVQTDASGNFVYIDIVPSDAAVTLTRAN